jgi:hypothetical protein
MDLVVWGLAAVVAAVVLAVALVRIIVKAVSNAIDYLVVTFGNERSAEEVRRRRQQARPEDD